MKALEKLLKMYHFNLNEWVSTWIDDEEQVKSDICIMVSHNIENWEVIVEIDNGGLDHIMLLNVHGCLVIFRFGMPDSFWYKRKDEKRLSSKCYNRNYTLTAQQAGSIHHLINIRQSHLTHHNGLQKWEPSYRRAYEAIKHCRWAQQNLLARLRQGSIGDGNYNKGQG